MFFPTNNTDVASDCAGFNYWDSAIARGHGEAFNFPKRLIIEGSWIRMVRRKTRRPELFLFFSPVSLRFVLGAWLPKCQGRVFLTLCSFYTHPQYHCEGPSDVPSLGYLVARMRPLKEHLRQHRQARDRQVAEKIAAIEADKDLQNHYKKYAKKHHLDKLEYALTSGRLTLSAGLGLAKDE